MEGLPSSKAPKRRPNRKTGETTSKGRPVWLDGSTGELYSERSVTFPVKEGESQSWFTIPTVAADGTQYEEDVVREYVEKNGAIDWITGEVFPSFKSEEEAVNYAKERSGTLLDRGYATGGVVAMNKMYDEGGLATDGMDMDPVSGNEIPVGSNAEDVRDDIDAKLSEGEYVIPADVVRYFGLEKIEEMVDSAKAGLADLDERGRIGGEPEEKEGMEEMEDMMDDPEGDQMVSDAELAFAEGGLVPGQVQPDIGALLDKAKARASSDPEFAQMLKAKGISIQSDPKVAPNKTMNNPVNMAEGGMVMGEGEYDPAKYTSSFNPEDYGLGFSSNYGMSGPAGVQKKECRPGTVWDSSKNMCVPVQDVDTGIKKKSELSKDSGQTGNDAEEGFPNKGNGNSWMDDYDYSDPEVLAEQTMTTLGDKAKDENEEKTLLQGLTNTATSIMGGGLAGGLAYKAIQGAIVGEKYSKAMANADYLDSQGFSDQANSIRSAAKGYGESKGLLGLFDSSKRKSRELSATRKANTNSSTSTINTKYERRGEGDGSSINGGYNDAGYDNMGKRRSFYEGKSDWNEPSRNESDNDQVNSNPSRGGGSSSGGSSSSSSNNNMTGSGRPSYVSSNRESRVQAAENDDRGPQSSSTTTSSKSEDDDRNPQNYYKTGGFVTRRK